MGHRFMYRNFIDDAAAISAASVEKGFVSAGAPRVANGSGTMIFSGAYAGDDGEVYTVEIDAPGDAGAARFRWRKTSTARDDWEASGVLTALRGVALDSGVKARFVNGADSPAFSLGDRWQAAASRPRSPKRIYDLDPGAGVRSASPPEDPWSLAVDFGAAKSPDVLIVHRHNFTSEARLRIQANASASWRAPALEEAVAWRSGALVHYLAAKPRAHRHWRLLVEGDAANPDAHLEASEIYLGGFFEPAEHFWLENVVGEEAFEEPGRKGSGAGRPTLLNRGRAAILPYRRVSDRQRAEFLAMYRAVKDVEAGRAKPLFTHLDVDDPASLMLADLAGGFLPRQEGPDDFSFDLELRERLP